MIIFNSKSGSANKLQLLFNELNYKPDILINWGRSQKLFNRSWDVIINAGVVGINKYTELEILKNNKIKTVNFSLDYRKLSGKILGRTNWHKKAEGINVYTKSPLKTNQDDFFTEYIENIDKEYRVHIIGKRSRVFEKTLVDSTAKQMYADIIVRNNKTGYKLFHIKESVSSIRHLAKKAIFALDADFGVVDLVKTDTGELIILEVNTRPLLSDNNINRYFRFLRILIDNKLGEYEND